MNDIIVIGGGAAGLMAAIAAAEKGAQVVLLEKNPECGRKILATGNGRCNFTNSLMNNSCYHSDDPDRVIQVTDQFDNHRLISFFDSLGIPAIARDGWYYPRSLSAESVQRALIAHAKRLGVRLKGGKKVTDLVKQDDHFDVYVDGYAYQAAKVILAVGGSAAPKTGSTGDGITLLSGLGVEMQKPLPALVPLVVHDNPLQRAAGVRCDVSLHILVNGELRQSSIGNLQITEYGVSGIPVFQVSSAAVIALDAGNKVEMRIDFLPGYDDDQATELLERLISQAKENYSSDEPASMILSGVFPEKLAEIFTGKGTIGSYQADAEGLAEQMKYYRIPISGNKGFSHAQTTSGGVIFDEINKDMSLKRVPGLYVCGELVDVDGECGGYNLQWAFSSGHLAGVSAAVS